MPKSKLVLFKSPSRNLVVYLDTASKTEECICKFGDRRDVFLGRSAQSNANTSNSTPDTKVETVTTAQIHSPPALKDEEMLENTKSTDNSDGFDMGYGEIAEHPGSTPVSDTDNIDDREQISAVKDNGSLRYAITPYFEPSDISQFHPFPESFAKFESSDEQHNDSLSVLKQAEVASLGSDLSRMYKFDSSYKEIPTAKSLSDGRPKTFRKTKFASDVSQIREIQASSVVIDENFIQQVGTIIEASSLASRKKQLDELLRSISTVHVTEVAAFETKKKTGCWPRIKKTKPKGVPARSIAPRPVPSLPIRGPKASDPYFNHSFYRYTLKSKLEGLSFMPHRNYKFGEKGSGFQSKGEPQDFYQLRDQCLQNGTLFEDREFPPTNSSLFFSKRPDRHFEWKRPGEIVDNPQLFVEGFSRFDVQQGELGDCWLLAAVANLTLYRRLFFQIVPDDQGFEEDYAGIFHFRFWQYGRWIDVVIDDRLPTYRGELVFLHSTEANEFWSALLEKAYAKLHGSYEALKGGSTCEAMEDFTGGVTEMYEMNASPPNLFKIIMKAYERWSLMGCSIEPDPQVLEAQTPEGLIRGHAYSITKVQYVNIKTPNVSGKIPLLRLRNPWGNESEWNGAWSDHSPEWHYISDSDKEELGLNFDADGEFWMSFKDFQAHFHRLEICNLNPDSLSADELTEGRNKKWVMSVFEGEWVRGVTAGGCRNFLDSFWHNPQYRITLEEVDEGEEEDDKCTLIVALMQKNRRQMRVSAGTDLLTIGFAIYYLPYPDKAPKPLDLNFFKYNASVARSPSFINLREVSCRFKLPRGTYCIVPSTFDPNEEGEFLLRVFSEHQNNMEENDQEIGLRDIDHKAFKVKKYRTVESCPVSLYDNKSSSRRKSVEYDKPELTPAEIKENDLVMELFTKVAAKDGEVDWKELQEILNYYTRQETKNRGFSKDVCRSMIAMLDTDRTGKLNFDEFKRLWTNVRTWKSVFRTYDTNNNGTLTGFELRNALNSAGYNLNNHILNILMHRYGNKTGEIEFDDFIMCAVKLKIMIEFFKSTSKDGTAIFTLEDWIETTLYA